MSNEEGNVIFFVENEDTWRLPLKREVVQGHKYIQQKLDRYFVDDF